MKNKLVRWFAGLVLICSVGALADDGPRRMGEMEIGPELLPKNGARRPEASEIEEKKLNKPISLTDLIQVFGQYLGKDPRRGSDIKEREIEIFAAPQATLKEIFELFYFALHNNGLGFDGSAGFAFGHFDPKAKDWNNRAELSKTKMIRLGYLNPAPVIEHYLAKFARSEGRIALKVRGNILFVSDTAKAIDELDEYVQNEIVRLIGVGDALRKDPNVHFYVVTAAKQKKIPLSLKKTATCTKEYKMAALWTTPQGFNAMAQEYVRINNLDIGESDSDVLPQHEQDKVAVDYGLVKLAEAAPSADAKKAATKKRGKR